MNEDADTIISRVLGRFHADDEPERNRTLRAVLVLDPTNVAALEPSLKESNFRLIVPPHNGLRSFNERSFYLAGRIFVTANTAPHILDDSPVLGYGIVGLDAIPFVNDAPDYKDNGTAQMISRVVSEYRLPSERSGYVVMLHPDGKHRFMRLE